MSTIPSNALESLRACVGELVAVLRGRVVLAVLLIVAIMLTEGIGIVLLIPLLAVAGFGAADGGGTLATVVDWLAARGLPVSLLPLLVLFLAAHTGRALLARWQSVNAAKVGEHFLHHLRMRLYHAFIHARYEYLTRVRPSDFIHALTDEVGRVGMIVYQLINLAGHVLVTLLLLFIALRLSWQATLVAVACALLLFLTLWRRTRRSESVGQVMTDRGAHMVATASEHLAGIKVAKSYGAEAVHEQAFRSFSEQVGAAGVVASRTYADVSLRFQIASAAMACVVIYISLAWLALPAAELLLLVIIFARLVPRFSSFQYGVQILLNALPAYDRVTGLAAAAEKEAGAQRIGNDAGLQLGEIVLEDVCFRYSSREDSGEILDINLCIPTGKTTALTGPSGAGKSTLADLMTGLLQPQAGQVRVSGKIAYVAQETFLFNDTVRINLSWVQPDASDESIWRALETARAAEFVRKLPHGLETVVGDRGVQLSGGERQRLALARALLSRPDILLLDEATSALDAENERAIYEALQQLHGQVTVLLITHRLASIEEVDLVYRMEGGRVTT